MGAIGRLARVAAVGAAVAVAVGACAEDDHASPAAAHLAERAETIAEHIDAGETCRALDQADQLVDRAWVTVNAGELPSTTAAQIERTVAEVVAQLTCDDEPAREAAGDSTTDDEPSDDATTDPATTEDETDDDVTGDAAEQGAAEQDVAEQDAGPADRSDGGDPGDQGSDTDPVETNPNPGRDTGGGGSSEPDTPGRSGEAPGRSGDAPGNSNSNSNSNSGGSGNSGNSGNPGRGNGGRG